MTRAGRLLGFCMVTLACWAGVSGCADVIRDGALAAVGDVTEDLVADILISILPGPDGGE